MKVSFVIPAHNEQHYISECLASVKAETDRVGADAEVIVVNNASTDGTGRIARETPGVTVVDEPQKGLVFARAAGFKASSGELIANVDADTRLPTGWLDRVLEAFSIDPKLVALSGPFIYTELPEFFRAMVVVFYSIGYAIQWVGKLFGGTGAMLQGGNFIVRRDALAAIGGYDTSITFYGEDTDIARRISKVGRVKWTFSLPIYASARRLKGEGIISMALKYGINYLSTAFVGRPFTKTYKDIRDVPSK